MIDELDRKIVWALNANARKSFREIAKEVGTSTTAVIHTVKKLETAGAIRGYIPVVDPEHFGINLIAIVAVRISQGKLLETQKKSPKIPGSRPSTTSRAIGIPSSSAISRTGRTSTGSSRNSSGFPSSTEP